MEVEVIGLNSTMEFQVLKYALIMAETSLK